MDLPDFSDTDFTAHKGVKKRPTTRRPKAEPPPPVAPPGNIVAGEPEKPKPKRKPRPGEGAPRHAPRTGKWKKRTWTAERRQASHLWGASGKWREPYLEFLRATGHKTASAEMAGITRKTVQDHADRDPEFAEAIDEALAIADGRLFASIMERATLGKKKYVFVNGERKYLGREPSDLLAMFMMKKLDPSFRDSYQGDDRDTVAKAGQFVAQFLAAFNPNDPNQADAPTLDEFKQAGLAAPGPAAIGHEDLLARRAQLQAEIDSLDARLSRQPIDVTEQEPGAS